MMHPHTELRFIDEQIGYGVVATRFIPRGTVTWVRDDFDQTFSPAQVERMTPTYREIVDRYCFADARGDYVLCWDLARYVNHSCEPSCRSAGYDFELAVRDIQPGEELTDDYGSLNLEYDFTCCCGSSVCRKLIRPGDLIRFGDAWDQLVAEPFRSMPGVPQPLLPMVRERAEIEAVLAGRAAIASCKVNYYAYPAAVQTPLTP